MDIGDIAIHKKEGYIPANDRENLLSYQESYYRFAIVASTNPFILISEDGKARWDKKDPEDFHFLCKASSEVISTVLKKLKDDSEKVKPARKIPSSIEEAFKILDEIFELNPDLEFDKCKTPNDIIKYHDNLGRWIRNNWGLWDAYAGDKNIFDDILYKERYDMHPDDRSYQLLRNYYISRRGN